MMMETTSEEQSHQDVPASNPNPDLEQQQQHPSDEPMEDNEDYNYDSDEYRQQFMPRGRGGFSPHERSGFEYGMRGGGNSGPRFRGRGFGPRGGGSNNCGGGGGGGSSGGGGQQQQPPQQQQQMYRPTNNGYPYEGTPRPTGPPGQTGSRFRGPQSYDPSWGPMGPPNMMGGPPNLMGPPGMGPPPHMMNGPMGQNNPYGPPGMASQINNILGQQQQQQPNNIPGLDLNGEVWVETKTGEGKSYFYNIRSRETTWTKPEGPNVKVMVQDQLEQLVHGASKQPGRDGSQITAPGTTSMQQQSQPVAIGDSRVSTNNEQSSNNSELLNQTTAPPGTGPPPMLTDTTELLTQNQQPTTDQQTPTPQTNGTVTPSIVNTMPVVNTSSTPAVATNMLQPPPNMVPMQHRMPNQYGAPMASPFTPSPFGMPPPGFQAFPTYGPPQTGWGMPQMPHTLMSQQAQTEDPMILAQLDPEIVANAMAWTEHRAPDGRIYFYNSKAGESVWEKPQAMKDFDQAKILLTQKNDENVNAMAIAAATAAAAATSTTTNDDKQSDNVNDTKDNSGNGNDIDNKNKKDDTPKEPAKPLDKSRPISSTPVPGTPWCVVWTGDGRVFFYNPSSRISVWEKPDDLLGRSDVDKMISTVPEALSGLKNINKTNDSSESSDDDQPIPAKKIKQDEPKIDAPSATPVKVIEEPEEEKEEKKTIDIGKEAAIEAEVKAARERAIVPLDTRIKSFKDMLAEKDVSAFSTWEKELHKIVFDPRYLLLTSKERKQVFEKYVKERAEEERREKRNKMKERKEQFHKLLDEANLHGKSSFSDFAQKHSRDERYKNVEKMRERESLFNEYLLEVRKREKDEKTSKREQIKKDFISMLREHKDIDRHSHWSDCKKRIESDWRYRVVDSTNTREDWFRDYIRLLKDERKKDKEKDKEKDKDKDHRHRDRDNHKSDKKDKDKKDNDKYKDKSSKDKDKEKDKDKDKESSSSSSPSSSSKDKKRRSENTNEENGKDCKKLCEKEVGEICEDNDDKIIKKTNDKYDEEHSDSEEDREKAKREREKRAEASLREREREVQRTLATHLRDRDKERQHHRHTEAVQHFNALLADLVRNGDLAWRETKRQLRKDHRWDLADSLDREEKERLFNEHIEQLGRKKRDKFRELLDEVGASTELTASWKDIRKLLKDDPRYTKFSSSDRKCEKEFREYIKDKLVAAKADFRELLQETKLITDKTFKKVQENSSCLTEIEDILKKDRRFLVLDAAANERTRLLTSYLEELARRGPPPPPTASEPSRRPTAN